MVFLHLAIEEEFLADFQFYVSLRHIESKRSLEIANLL